MGKWSQASRTHVATMKEGDFYHGEKSLTLDRARKVKMVLTTKSGEAVVLKSEVKLGEGDIIDSTSSYLYTMFPTRFTLVSGATLTSPLGTVYTLAISEDGGTITAS